MKEQTWQQWARLCAKDPDSPSKIKKGSLAALTGTDVRALDAFVPCIKLSAYCADDRLIYAASLLVRTMQPSTRWVARELIAFVLDWDDRERLWARIVNSNPKITLGVA